MNTKRIITILIFPLMIAVLVSLQNKVHAAGHQTPHFYQNVIEQNGDCKTYKFDIAPHGGLSNEQELNCQISIPSKYQMRRDAGVSYNTPRNVQQYTNWFVEDRYDQTEGYLNEAIWLNGHGFMRKTRVNNGYIPSIRSSWNYVGSYSSLGLPYNSSTAQGATMVGNDFHQMVFEPNGNCHRYEGYYSGSNLILDTNYQGAVDYGCEDAPRNCRYFEDLRRTVCPGDVSSYTVWVHGDKLYEALWRTNIGYLRERNISSNGNVDWNSGRWEACCHSGMFDGGSSPRGQGGYVLWE